MAEIQAQDAPLPLSFPAILRNPGISDPYAYLHTPKSKSHGASSLAKKVRRDQNEGKRWVRRKDNARFVGNPHIIAATRWDYSLQPAHARATFPEPLPPYLPRTVKVPSANPPILDPNSANAGRFSLSLKGMRRELRKSGFRAEVLVRDIEHEIVDWLQGGTVLSPDSHDANVLESTGTLLGDTRTIFELSRSPLQLIWSIADDAFARYVVHCCARYHEVVSYSKEESGRRLTYLLRPNVTRPNFQAAATLDTPPVTDLDYSSQIDSSQIDSESDFISDRDTRSETGDSDIEVAVHKGLPVISEDSVPESSINDYPGAPELLSEDSWSLIGETDAEGDESGSEVGLASSMGSLSLRPEVFPTEPHLRQTSTSRRVWEHRRGRSTSSPSRSPARRLQRRGKIRLDRTHNPTSGSFYDYLFS